MRVILALMVCSLAVVAQEGSGSGGEPPEHANDPAALELLTKVERKAVDAKTLVLKLTMEVDQGPAKGQFSGEVLLKRDGNKAVIALDGNFGDAKARVTVKCDGKAIRQTGDRGEREMPARDAYEQVVRRLVVMGGVMPAMEMAAEVDPESLGKMEAFGVKFAGEESIGDKKAKIVQYMFGMKQGMRMEEKIWIDEATQTILKREMKDPTGANRVTETYMEVSPDKEIDDAKFAPAK